MQQLQNSSQELPTIQGTMAAMEPSRKLIMGRLRMVNLKGITVTIMARRNSIMNMWKLILRGWK